MITGNVDWWWGDIGVFVLAFLIFATIFATVFSSLFFVLPKDFRSRNLRLRLPLVFGAVHFVVWMALSEDLYGDSIENFFYILVNVPIVPLLMSEGFSECIEQVCGKRVSDALPIVLAVLYWMLATFLIGYWIDRRRAKKAQSVTSSLSPTPGQQP